MSETLIKVLGGWINNFQGVEDRLIFVVDAAEALFAHLESIPAKIDEVERKVCKKDACLEPIIREYLNKVLETISAVKAFVDAQKGAQQVVEIVPELVNITRSAITIADSIPDTDEIISMILRGDIKEIQDILEVIKITKELPKIVEKLQNGIEPVLQLTTYFDGRGSEASSLLQDVLSGTWESYPFEFSTNSSGNVRAGVREIQAVLREGIEVPFLNVTDAVTGLIESIKTIPIKKGNFEFNADVASYRRWSTISMDLPCTRQARATYSVAGYKGSFDYPEFYSCSYGPKEVPWPNHHIPYFKFRIA